LDEPIQKLIENGKFTHLPNCINQIMEIPEKSARIELCQKLAARGLGRNGKAIKNSTNLLIKKIKGSISFQVNEIPSLELAQNKIQVEKPKWDILYQAGKIPSWTAVYKSAMETCNTCSRRPLASEVTCKNCLAAALLLKLIEVANREKARSMAEKVVRKRAIANGIR
jgi:hypothetical protein